MKFTSTYLVLLSYLWAQSSLSAITFSFINNGSLDGNAGIGSSFTASSGTQSATLSTVDILFPEFLSSVPTGNTLSASGQNGGGTSIHGSNGVGVDNPTISNNAFDIAFGPGDENNNFNAGEVWIFNFSTAVIITEIDFTSLDGQEQFTLSTGGSSRNFQNGTPNDIFQDPLNGLFIPAGAPIQLAASGGPDASLRLNSLTVELIPEPTASGLLILAGLFTASQRRRR